MNARATSQTRSICNCMGNGREPIDCNISTIVCARSPSRRTQAGPARPRTADRDHGDVDPHRRRSHDLGPAGMWRGGRCASRCGRDCRACRDDGYLAAFVVVGPPPTLFCRRCANDHTRPRAGGGSDLSWQPPVPSPHDHGARPAAGLVPAVPPGTGVTAPPAPPGAMIVMVVATTTIFCHGCHNHDKRSWAAGGAG